MLAKQVDPNMKVLVVDDLRSVRLVMRKTLAQLGINNVVEAGDGQQALDLLAQQPDVKLIICDWMMPNMEGIEVAWHLQADPRLQNIPLIMATSKSELEDITEATVKGVWGYIVKPVGAEELAKEINGVFTETEISDLFKE